MPKQKTHKGISKVLKIRKSGTITRGRTGGNHNTGKKDSSFKRKNRSGAYLSKADRKRIRKII